MTMLDTRNEGGRPPLLAQDGTNWVFLLEKYELVMSDKQLDRITEYWNRGTPLELLAEIEKRKEIEVLVALLHQADRGHKLKPFAFREVKT